MSIKLKFIHIFFLFNFFQIFLTSIFNYNTWVRFSYMSCCYCYSSFLIHVSFSSFILVVVFSLSIESVQFFFFSFLFLPYLHFYSCYRVVSPPPHFYVSYIKLVGLGTMCFGLIFLLHLEIQIFFKLYWDSDL